MIKEHVYIESIILEEINTRKELMLFLRDHRQLLGFTKNSLPLGNENSLWIPLTEQRWREKNLQI